MTVQPLFLPVRHVARLTLEAVTPLSIASGESDPDLDAPLFRDWNGLPCLSGSGVAGVLRSLCADHDGDVEGLFGFEANGVAEGQASRLMVSFGLAHDSQGHASRELLDAAAIRQDPVLALLAKAAPILRDNVAIAETGAAKENAKFDRAACPAGTRFSIDIAIDGEDDADSQTTDQALLTAVVGLLSSPYARFGGATRRGLGRLKVVVERSWIASIDRRGGEGRARWVAFRGAAPHDGPAICGFKLIGALSPPAQSGRRPVTTELRLQPQGFWRAGQGRRAWTEAPADGKGSLARMPLSEPLIQWSGGTGVVRNVDQPTHASLPGAGLKGALAHRAEYHLRRIEGQFGLNPGGARLLDRLLGSANDGDGGRAGALLIDDIQIDYSGVAKAMRAARRARNSIDRHTGGVRNGKLFNDEALWKGPVLTASITVLMGDVSDENALRALDWAIADLCAGELVIGSGDAIGDGVMRGEGEVIWSVQAPSLVDAAHRAKQGDA